jgi:hypothetical protein
MKFLLFIVLSGGMSLIATAQTKQLSLQFKDPQLSPSQYIHRQFIQIVPAGVTDSLCAFILTSVKFSVTAKGKVTKIMPSVGLPVSLVEPLKKALSSTETQWINKRKEDVDCILPIMILPASLCPGERPNNTLQSGAQMFKYSGEYIDFPFAKFYDYNVDLTEGVILSPILIRNGKIY